MLRPTPKQPLTKRELFANIARASGLSKKQVAAMLDALAGEIRESLGSDGAGFIKIPGLMTIENKKFRARQAQTGVPNPFKPGTVHDIPAKPAYSKIKVRTLKLLRQMAM